MSTCVFLEKHSALRLPALAGVPKSLGVVIKPPPEIRALGCGVHLRGGGADRANAAAQPDAARAESVR